MLYRLQIVSDRKTGRGDSIAGSEVYNNQKQHFRGAPSIICLYVRQCVLYLRRYPNKIKCLFRKVLLRTLQIWLYIKRVKITTQHKIDWNYLFGRKLIRFVSNLNAFLLFIDSQRCKRLKKKQNRTVSD